MAKEHTKDLIKFLKPFSAETRDIVLSLREFVWDQYPKTNELIYDNYNALAIGWSPTDRVGHIFCNMAIGRTNSKIQFGFLWGAEISDPKKMLIGEGKQYRYFVVTTIDDFPKGYFKKLIKEAYGKSLGKIKDSKQIMTGHTITKSVSPVKRKLKSTSKKKKK